MPRHRTILGTIQLSRIPIAEGPHESCTHSTRHRAFPLSRSSVTYSMGSVSVSSASASADSPSSAAALCALYESSNLLAMAS